LKSVGHIFTQLLALVRFGRRMNASGFWGHEVKVQGQDGSNMVENALFGLVNMTSWRLLDWILPDKHWCSLGQGWTFQLLGSKVKVTAWPHRVEAYRARFCASGSNFYWYDFLNFVVITDSVIVSVA